MWIIMPAVRKYHRDKIKVGLKDYFMERLRKIAECEVVELLRLRSITLV